MSRPACSEGHVGKVLLDGRRLSRDGKTQRHRYRCVPANGEKPHRFTPPLPGRRSTGHGHTVSQTCRLCQRPFRQGDGVSTPRGFEFSVDELASALARVGRGESYRHVSLGLHNGADKVSTEQSNLVMSYLDSLAPVVIEPLKATAWPEIVTLDAWPIVVRTRRLRPRRVGPPYGTPPPRVPRVPSKRPRLKTREVGRVLAASGQDGPTGRSVPWLVRFAGGGDETSWAEFLRSLPGVPRWVVADRDQAITNAVGIAWGSTPYIYYSEHHLLKNVREAAAKDGHDEGSQLWHVLGGLQRDLASIQACGLLAVQLRATTTDAWIARNTQLLMNQVAARTPGHPQSAAAAEAILRRVSLALDKRKHLLKNADRLDRTLALIRAEAAGLASEPIYAQLLREHLARREAGDPIFWRDILDPRGTSSMEEMARDAQVRAKGATAVRNAPRKSARMLQRKGLAKAQRQAQGLPPVPYGIPKRIPATGSVAGKSVADFPWLVAEWHPTSNGTLAPAGTPAGTGEERWWLCPNDPEHEWQAQVRSRSIRGSRCPFCTNRKVQRSATLAVTDPDLAREWHPTKNGALTPDQVTRGSHREVWWQCPRYKTHVYQTRISSRTSMLSGCPHCARKDGKGGRPRQVRGTGPASGPSSPG